MFAKCVLGAAMALGLCSAAPMPSPDAPEAIAQANRRAAEDGYVFERKDFTSTFMTLRIVPHQNLHDLRMTWHRRNPGERWPDTLMAFATWNATGCEIHIIDPGVSYEPARIGHELTHCMHGHFHVPVNQR